MECEYCNKKLSSIVSLRNHKNSAKYCLLIQEELGKLKNVYTEKCIFCDKYFKTKVTLKNHLKKCFGDDLIKINDFFSKQTYNLENEINILKTDNNTLKHENISLKTENSILKNENNSLKTENSSLKTENSSLKTINKILESDHECIQEIAKQPKNITNTNNTNNKILNIITPLDLSSVDIIKNKINNNYKLDYIFSGQKGIAKFAFDHILKDDEGNLKYVCTDPSRQIFKYKDETGEVRKDVEAKKLTNFLVEGGIKHKAANIMNDWWTEETGIKNTDKFELLVDKAESLRIIDTDNNEFKKELITMTTV